MEHCIQNSCSKADSKSSVEVENSILSASESRLECIFLEDSQGGFGMNSFVEQICQIREKLQQPPPPLAK